MRRAFLSVFLLLLIASAHSAERQALSLNHVDGERFMDVTLLGTLRLDGLSDNGIEVGEMSGLAWSDSSMMLYAVSNDGYLFHFRPAFDSKGVLVDARLIKAIPLLDKDKRVLGRRSRDAEGLTLLQIKGRETLAISFEGQHRIDEYDPEGHWIRSHDLPDALRNGDRFDSPNKGMESITYHPQYGLLTSTELPLRDQSQQEQVIFSLDGNRQWRVARSRLPAASVVGLDVSAEGDVIMLERSFESILQPIATSIYKITLNDACGAKAGARCKKQLVARFESDKEWNIDNFEGLTRFGERGYFMVSDNNRFWLQRTLLSHFRIEAARSDIETVKQD